MHINHDIGIIVWKINILWKLSDISKSCWSATASSSNHITRSPDLAIDGVFQEMGSNAGYFHAGSHSPNEWLQIDMGAYNAVARVEILF